MGRGFRPEYRGGVAIQYLTDDDDKVIRQDGYVARRWDPNVADRYYKFLGELGMQFDGLIEGINLPETAVGFGESVVDPRNGGSAPAVPQCIRRCFRRPVWVRRL